jgi:hypothetical protein
VIQLLLILFRCHQAGEILELKSIRLKVNLSDGLECVQYQCICDVERVSTDIYFFQLHTILFKVYKDIAILGLFLSERVRIHEFDESILVNVKSRLPILCHLILSLVVVHQVGPKIEYVRNIRQLFFFRLALYFKVQFVILAAILLLQRQIIPLQIDDHGEELLRL